MIDSRLQVLRLVASLGTVTAAADALHFTPSAASHQLRTLSRDLGVDLLVRKGRGVHLTPAGRQLLSHTDALYAHWEEIRADVARVDEDRVGELRLCGFSTAAAALLPTVATQIQQQHPRASVRIIEADPEECFDLLLADDADLAVVVATATLPPSNDPRFDQRPLFDDPLDLLVPEGHPLAERASVRLSDAADESWILDRPGRPLHQLVVAACSAAGFTPHATHQASGWDTGAALVAAGFGVALAPRLARIPGGYPLRRVTLEGDPAPARHLLTGVRRGSRDLPEIAAALAVLDDLAARSHDLQRW